jgi:ABC-type multidrug transport system ATPase subunit
VTTAAASTGQTISADFTPAVLADALGKEIDDRSILRQISFRIEPGEFIALLGANGAGKSTLLKLLATLTSASEGQLRLFGREAGPSVAAVRDRLGMIGHGAMLYRDLTLRENLVFFGRLYGVKSAGDRAEELLERVGLAHRADDAVKTLSRGMMQRVSIARAVMHDPALLLADEPFAGLDAPSSRIVEQMLAGLHDAGKTVILANHDIGQSLRLAQRALVLRRGRLVIDSPSDELDVERVLEEVGGK